MKNNFLKDRPGLRRKIRIAEIVAVTILLVYAAITYRQLKILRAAPVVLPAFWFNVASGQDQVQRIQARGSWASKDATPEFMHTTTIECVKARMQCIESSAVVAVQEGGFLESVQTLFDIESWTDSEVRTKTDVQPCVNRTLIFDIANKQAQSILTGNPANKSCKASVADERVFQLVTGQQARSAAVKKASEF